MLQQQRTDFFKPFFADVAGVTVSHHDILASIGKIVNTFLQHVMDNPAVDAGCVLALLWP